MISQTTVRRLVGLLAVAALLPVAVGCRRGEEASPPGEREAPGEEAPGKTAPPGLPPGWQGVDAVAEIFPLAGEPATITGVVAFTRAGGGVRIEARVNGLTYGEHGFHIHEYGDCTAPDGLSAGDRFDPDGSPRAGDLGNLEADGYGYARLDLTSDRITLGEGERSVLGRAVIIHEGPDALAGQPSGGAGARIACGLILKVKGDTPPVRPGAP